MPKKTSPKAKAKGVALAISPSIFERVAGCPGSAQLCADIPVVVNAAMERGTALHKELEEAFLGHAPAKSESVKFALEALLQTRKGLNEEHGLVTQYVEERLDFAWLGIELGPERGRVDYAFVAGPQGVVVDFKTGRGGDSYDHPEQSWQMILYAIALSKRFPAVDAWDLRYLAPERDGDKYTSGKVTRDQLAEYEELAISIVAEAKSKSPRFETGDHCRWCPGKSVCKLMSQTLPAVGGDSDLVSVVDKFVAMAPTGRAEIWAKVQAAKEWLASVEADIVRLAQDHPVEGYECKPYRIDKRWTDEGEASVVEALGDRAFEKRLVTPAAAKKLGFNTDGHTIDVPAALALKKVKR